MMIDGVTKHELLQECEAAEQQGCLTKKQLDILYNQKWLKLFVPKELGGLNYTLLEGLQLEEELAAIDGSIGWTVTLCSGASLFCGYLPWHLNERFFAEENVCFGGSGAASGTAEETEHGYVLNGYWKYATGALHNTVFTANCRIIKKGGAPKETGTLPVVRPFVFLKNEVSIHKEWNMMGLKATGSHSFSVHNLQLSKERCFSITAEAATLPQAIYSYPFLQLAEATLAVNTLGMAQHFLDECELMLQAEKAVTSSPQSFGKRSEKVLLARQQVAQWRSRFYDSVAASWHPYSMGQQATSVLLQQVSDDSRQLAREVREIVHHLYPFCGMQAARENSTINRVWRDLFTASQHSLLNAI